MTAKINKDKKQKTAKSLVGGANVNYPVGDFLIRVKNAALAGKPVVSVPNTSLVFAASKVLESEGFISNVKVDDGVLTASIARYAKESKLLGLELVSRPGLRRYVGVQELSSLRGPEIYVISTSKGVMSSKEALKKVLGGELIAKVW